MNCGVSSEEIWFLVQCSFYCPIKCLSFLSVKELFISIQTKFYKEECFQIILPELYFSTLSLNLSAMGKEEDMCLRLSSLPGASNIWSVANDWYRRNTNWAKQKGTQLLLIIWVWENIVLILPIHKKGTPLYHDYSKIAVGYI